MLRGRCRQCHNPISARYPIVEAITATMFGLLAIVEIDRLDTIYPFHLLLLCTLLCAALIEFDGNRPPLRLFVPAFIVGVIAMLFWPQLRLISMWVEWPTGLSGVFDGLIGLSLGASLGGIAWLLPGSKKPAGLMFGLICIGLFLGWFSLGWIAACTAALHTSLWGLWPVSKRFRIPATMSLTVVTLGWIVFALAPLIPFPY
jgi:leader peptidase (prepilin peptidase) / N-methyltransferase